MSRRRAWETTRVARALRRRRIERLLKELDHHDATGRSARQASGLGGRVARGVGIPLACLLVMGWWVLHNAPRALPIALQERLGVAAPEASPRTYTDGDYTFTKTQTNDPSMPVGFNPCRRIAIEVNLKGAPTDGLALVRGAIADVRRASGLDLQFVGTTRMRPTTRPLGGAVIVSWATAHEIPELKGKVAGLGGPGPVARGVAGTSFYTGGRVTLDADAFRSMTREEQQGVVDHEFGHLVGLAHVASKRELMYPQASSRTTYGHGDLTALAKLGGLSCR